MANLVLLWTDNEAAAHVRLLDGTPVEAEAALAALKDHYGDDDFFESRWLPAEGGFQPVSVIYDEVEAGS